MSEHRGANSARLLVVCTGNAARSVMAGVMLKHLAHEVGKDVHVVTAGTHALEGRPMSNRTRSALESIGGLEDLELSSHRSHQLSESDLSSADVVIAMEVDNVSYVRRRHEEAALKTGLMRTLATTLPEGEIPLDQKVKLLELGCAVLDPVDDVADPAGKDEDAYVECALELWGLSRQLMARL